MRSSPPLSLSRLGSPAKSLSIPQGLGRVRGGSLSNSLARFESNCSGARASPIVGGTALPPLTSNTDRFRLNDCPIEGLRYLADEADKGRSIPYSGCDRIGGSEGNSRSSLDSTVGDSDKD